MANFLVKSYEDFSSIKPLVQKLKRTVMRTGGTVSNYSKSNGGGYNFNFWDLVRNRGWSLISYIIQQRNMSKNYLEIIGDICEGMEIIYVVNITQSITNAKRGIEILESYGCKVVLELGNEQYFAPKGMSPQQYLRKCEEFEKEFGDKYLCLYQLSTHKADWAWNDYILKEGRAYTWHDYSATFSEFKNKADHIFSLIGSSTLYVSEWNRQTNAIDGFEDTSEYHNFVINVLNYLESKGAKNTFHNLVGDTWGVFTENLQIRQSLYNLLK